MEKEKKVHVPAYFEIFLNLIINLVFDVYFLNLMR